MKLRSRSKINWTFLLGLLSHAFVGRPRLYGASKHFVLPPGHGLKSAAQKLVQFIFDRLLRSNLPINSFRHFAVVTAILSVCAFYLFNFKHYAFGNENIQKNSLIQLDPHGKKDIKPSFEEFSKNQSCTVCHKSSGTTVTIEIKTEQSCLNCHNQKPHSGISEHQKAKITCIGCHTPHRYEGKTELNLNSGPIRNDIVFEKPLQLRHNPNSLIKKTCTECHKW